MILDHLVWVDMAALLLIVLGAVQGVLRGLSGELARLLGALLAWIAGIMLYEPLGAAVAQHTRLEPEPARVFTFVATVIAALILLMLFHRLLKLLLAAMLQPGFDRIAGVPAGMLRMATLVCIVFVAVRLSPDSAIRDAFGPPSLFGKLADRFVPTARRTLEESDLPHTPFSRFAPDTDEPDNPDETQPQSQP